jgi:hypothetical protein
MASGLLGQSSLAAATNTTVYTAAETPTTFTVSMLNTTGFPIAVNLAISSAATPVDGEYIEFQTVIPGNSVLERGGIVTTSGERIVAFANFAGINVNIYGFEG